MMPDPANQPKPPTDGGDDETGPYRIADEAPHGTPGRPSASPVEPTPDLSDSQDADDVDSDGTDEESSLPPPISRPGGVQLWLLLAGICAALLMISWLAGAPQLSLPDADGNLAELSFGERLNGLARTIVFVPLAAMSGVFGLCALAFVRQRPIGAPAPLLAKSLAIVCVATLTWLVPSEIRIVKQALHVIGMPALAAVLAIPIFRLGPRDAVLATAFALLGMLLLVFGAWIVVWATT
jgi:hypothetical protein